MKRSIASSPYEVKRNTGGVMNELSRIPRCFMRG